MFLVPPYSQRLLTQYWTISVFNGGLVGLFAISAVYSIVKLTPKISAAYRKYQLALLIWGSAHDLTLTIGLHPMGSLPHICIMMDGLLQRWMGISTRIQSVIMAISITGNMIPYGASFYYRHQVVMPPGSRWKLNYNRGFALWIGYICAMIAANSTWIYFMPISEKANREYVEEIFANWSVSFRSRITCYGEDSEWFARAAVLYILMCLSFMTVTSTHIFYTIANHRTISLKNKSFHKKMTILLIIQAVIPTMFLIAPCSIIAVQYFLRYYDQVWTLFAAESGAFHSIALSILIIGSIIRKRLIERMAGIVLNSCAIFLIVTKGKLEKYNGSMVLVFLQPLLSDVALQLIYIFYLAPSLIIQDYFIYFPILDSIAIHCWFNLSFSHITLAVNRVAIIVLLRFSFFSRTRTISIALFQHFLAAFLTVVCQFILPCCKFEMDFTIFSYRDMPLSGYSNYAAQFIKLPLQFACSIVPIVCYCTILVSSRSIQKQLNLQSNVVNAFLFALQFAFLSAMYTLSWIAASILPSFFQSNEDKWTSAIYIIFALLNSMSNAFVFLLNDTRKILSCCMAETPRTSVH